MTELSYMIIECKDITDDIALSFVKMLKRQNKVNNPNKGRIKSCPFLCKCVCDNKLVGIGAIKNVTTSDFNVDKANLPALANAFKHELGYFYTMPDYQKNGISTNIFKMLSQQVLGCNLMATTELRSNNSMQNILLRNGFQQYGNPWKSTIHDGHLGLFLKFI